MANKVSSASSESIIYNLLVFFCVLRLVNQINLPTVAYFTIACDLILLIQNSLSDNVPVRFKYSFKQTKVKGRLRFRIDNTRLPD